MYMEFIKKSTELPDILAGKINSALNNHARVAWLVPGGSNIPISVQAMKLIEDSASSRLVIMQTDERFVSPKSADCNWLQLMNSGFNPKKALTFPVPLDQSKTIDEVVDDYASIISREFKKANYIIGQFGFGADGHIAGIKPNSTASNSSNLVAGYQAADFKRITLTFVALKQLSAAYAFASGASKQTVIEKLAAASQSSVNDFPVKILSEIPESIIYNDIINLRK